MDDAEAIFYISELLTASKKFFRYMSNAWESLNCSFSGLIHISEKNEGDV